MNGLVVSTTVRVVDRVHGHTGNVRVELATGLGLVVGSTGGSHWHLISAVTGEHTDGGSAVGGDFFRRAGWHANTNLVANTGFNDAGITSRSSDFTTVARAEFKVVDRRSFWNVAKFGDVAWSKGHVVADGDLAPDGDAFGGCDQRCVAVWCLDAGQGCAVNRAVNQFGDLTDHVFVAWHLVLTGETVAGHAVAWRGTFALCTNSLTHG